jgi:PAS domain S-box-containing protein
MRESAQAGLWFLDCIDRVNRAIAGTHELEQMMNDVLDVVLDVFDCDRAWLSTPELDNPAVFMPIAERTRPGYPGGLATGRPQEAPEALQAMFRDVLAASGPLTFDEQQLAASGLPGSLGVRSMMVVALRPKQMYAFGLHQCSRPRTWTREERDLLAEIGDRVAIALNALLLFRDLRASERRLIAAEELANIGYWDQDVVTRQVKLSAQAAKIFGLAPDRRVLTAEEFRDVVHPDDRERVGKEARDALLTGTVLDVEGRVIRADGSTRLIHTRARLVADNDGQARRVFGTAQDVTERRLQEVTQHEIEMRFRAFVDHATDALFLLDSNGQVIDVNQSACESLGYTRAELLGISPIDFNIDAVPGFAADLAARFAAEDTFSFDSLQRR